MPILTTTEKAAYDALVANAITINDSTTSIDSVYSSDKTQSLHDAQATEIDNLTSAIQNSLLAEYVVSGSAVTSIDFSGLDINTHKSYRAEVELVNGTASSADIYCFFNGNTTLTNYYSQLLQSNTSTTTSIRLNKASVFSLTASSIVNGVVIVLPKIAIAQSIRNIGSTIMHETYSMAKTIPESNITQLTFTSSATSAIGVGSKIRIYRGDV